MLRLILISVFSLLAFVTAKPSIHVPIKQSTNEPTSQSANQPVIDVSLDGNDWFLTNANRSIKIPATVPGSNFLDLINYQSTKQSLSQPINRQVDPYYRFNANDTNWISYEPYWTWTKTFSLTDSLIDSLINSSHIELQFDGLDTIANVSLNGHFLGRSINQFRKVVYDVTGLLHQSTNQSANQLVVTIESPILYAQNQHANYSIYLPVSDPSMELPYRNFIRKVQSDFGWDWGVQTCASGIWKSVRLLAFGDCVVEAVGWQTTPGYALTDQAINQSNDKRSRRAMKQAIERSINEPINAAAWYANVTVYLRTTQYAPVNGRLTITLDGGTFSQSFVQPISLPSLPRPFNGDRLIPQSIILSINQPDLQLWWPRDYGHQILYNLTVSFSISSVHQSIEQSTTQSMYQSSDQSIDDLSGDHISSMSKLVAFRTITIDRSKTPKDAEGLSMTFMVNNQSIYIKGANLVPLDAFPGRVSVANITRLMDAAYAANMNLIRVWGGGYIQDPSLYDYADQYGILIWQEMLFACAQYPADEASLQNVREEVSQIVRGISFHASLAVIGGNNENEAMFSWQPETQGLARDHYLVAYNELYVNTIRSVLVREVGATNVEYVASSPSNGPRSLEPYTLQWGDPQSVSMGDVHWYDYSADLAEVKSFPRPRFLSEFGAQSHSSLVSYSSISLPEDWSWNSPLMLFRQHHPDGNDQMQAQIAMHFNLANSTNTTLQFSDQIYLSQVSQSLSYTTAFHHWRRIQSESGYCKGIIYWQLNDQWQAPTWASIEHNGRWKLTHNAVSNAYEQMIISGYLTPYKLNHSASQPVGRSLEELVNQYADADFGVYAVNDASTRQGGYVNISLRSWLTGEVIYSVTQSINVSTTTSMKVYGTSINQFLLDSESQTCVPRTNCWIHLTWYQSSTDQSIHPSVKQTISQSAIQSSGQSIIQSDLVVSEFPVWLDALIDAPLNNSQMMIDVEMDFIDVSTTDGSIDGSADVPFSSTDLQLLRHAARYSNTPSLKRSLINSLHQTHPVNKPQLVIRLHVMCHTPAAYVTFESPVDGRWDDNGFLCTPQTTGRYLTFYPVDRTIDHNYFRTTLNYYSIWDTYNRG